MDQGLDDPQDNHRHVSHLYALYPGNQITPEKNTGTLRCCPYFADTSWRPEYRLVDGMEGLSLARLLDGNHAYKLIHNQLTLTDDHFLAYGLNKKKGGT